MISIALISYMHKILRSKPRVLIWACGHVIELQARGGGMIDDTIAPPLGGRKPQEVAFPVHKIGS
jgi:hypothetical protein